MQIGMPHPVRYLAAVQTCTHTCMLLYDRTTYFRDSSMGWGQTSLIEGPATATM